MSGAAFRQLDAATSAQNAAADPAASVWVSANAGSGKTRALTTRVARLLLAGAQPSRILCLTYTKAAAAEMQQRLFDLLGRWAMAPEEALADSLDRILGENEPALGPQRRDEARRLFARALETPGGLRIQTIHAFCESLLSRFPLEAGVSPHFQVIDEAIAEQLRSEACDRAIQARSEDPALAEAFSALFARHDESTVDDLFRQALGLHRAYDAAAPDALAGWLGAEIGVGPGAVLEGWRARLDAAALSEMVGALSGSSKKTDQSAADHLRALLAAPTPEQAWRRLCAALFTQKGAAKATIVTKEALAAHGWLEPAVGRLLAEAQAVRERLNAAERLEASQALAVVTQALLAEYRALKFQRAGLDYDDLIDRAVGLLTRSEARDWVRFKLDGGVEHILVDEAQDTSPEQWRAIEALAEEFFSGLGAREDRERDAPLGRRTVFAVGDEKQSIFSFQGAAPELLSKLGRRFDEKSGAAASAFRRQGLDTSFRSAPAILRFVDAVFASDEARQGLSFDGAAVAHRAFRVDAPGLIELWPLMRPITAEAPPAWDAPLDAPPPDDPERRLADLLARTIAGWIGREPLPGRNRVMRAGDILVLVRNRGRLSTGLIKRLKQLGAPVAGQDRLSLASELAVKDLLALARFCLFPEDDLTLAALLRSPFCAVSEEQLFDLAHHRAGRRPLWYALKERRAETEALVQAEAFLQQMIDAADYLRPFELFARALGPMGGRARLTARLGREAEDPIDEFLAQALAFETSGAPTLQGFVEWIAAREAEIKREHEHGRDEIRVMTAHGAKGLEAPVVVVPDTTRAPSGGRTPALLDPKCEGVAPIRLGRAESEPESVLALREQAAAREAEEHRRLFYVALTRAEDRLLICGATRLKEPPAQCWHTLCAAAIAELGDSAPSPVSGADDAPLPGWRFEEIPAPTRSERPTAAPDDGRAAPPVVAPEWVRRPAAAETAPSDISPSHLGAQDPEAAPDTEGFGALPPDLARRRGVAIHALLERLPALAPEARRAVAARILAREADGFSDSSRGEMAREALAVIEDPALAWLFAPGALAEAPLGAILPQLGPGETHGVVDRLVVTDDRLTIVDFKTGAAPDAPPDAYLRQLAVYRAALRRLYPDKRIAAGLLWTAERRLQLCDDAALDEAFERAAREVDRRRSDT